MMGQGNSLQIFADENKVCRHTAQNHQFNFVSSLELSLLFIMQTERWVSQPKHEETAKVHTCARHQANPIAPARLPFVKNAHARATGSR